LKKKYQSLALEAIERLEQLNDTALLEEHSDNRENCENIY